MKENYSTTKKQLVFTEENRNLSLDDIEKFEKENELTFPDDFKNFLLIYNGTSTDERNKFIYRFDDDTEDNEFCLIGFIDLEDMEVFKDTDCYEEWRENVDDDSIPFFYDNLLCIAYTDDSGHSEICISLDERNKGSIYLVCDKSPSLTAFLSNSFTNFINSFFPTYENEFEEACKLENSKKAIELIKSGFNLNTEYSSSILAEVISIAWRNKDFIEVLNLILNSDYNPSEEDFMASISYQNLEIVKSISSKIKKKCKGALGRASSFDNLEIIKFLYKEGYDVNELYYNTPPLIHAVMSGRFEMVEFLLEKGADYNLKYVQDKNNLNAIEWAKFKIEETEKYNDSEKYVKCFEILKKYIK